MKEIGNYMCIIINCESYAGKQGSVPENKGLADTVAVKAPLKREHLGRALKNKKGWGEREG